MNILSIIKRDHEAVGHIFNQLEHFEKMKDHEISILVNHLITEIKLHAKAEELALYEVCRNETEALSDFSIEGFIEHRLLDTVLGKLPKVKPGSEFKALLKVARDLFEHHAREEEEKEIFPKLQNAFSSEELTQLGDSMMDIKEKLRSEIEEKVAAKLSQTKPTKSRLPQSLQ